LTVTGNGEVRQVLETIAGQEIKLVVRPDGQPESVTGRIVFYPEAVFGKANKQESSLDSSLATIGSRLLAFVGGAQISYVAENRLAVLDVFSYKNLDGDGDYEALVKLPMVAGRYNVQTIIKEKNGQSKEIELITVVDPEGYVYRKAGEDEARIRGVEVSLYWKNTDGVFQLWLAVQFHQKNPQITGKTGTYSFLVPEGEYYINAITEGYKDYRGKKFVVQRGINVHENIELNRKGLLTRLFKMFGL